MKNTQVFFIHGGETFKTRADYLDYLRQRQVSITPSLNWSGEYLNKKLGKGFTVIRPRMPLSENCRYSDWKITFERYFPYLKNNIVLIGYSQGGIFLAKYLSENKFPKKILSVYLVAAPFHNPCGGFSLPSSLSGLEKSSRKVNLLFAHQDQTVPVIHAKKYAQKLERANIIIYDHISGHFRVSEFPELIKMIKRDVASLK